MQQKGLENSPENGLIYGHHYGRLQAVKQDMLERHGVLERRRRDSEEAVGTQKATHEKALSKLIAQQARKVRPWLSCIMLSAWR